MHEREPLLLVVVASGPLLLRAPTDEALDRSRLALVDGLLEAGLGGGGGRGGITTDGDGDDALEALERDGVHLDAAEEVEEDGFELDEGRVRVPEGGIWRGGGKVEEGYGAGGRFNTLESFKRGGVSKSNETPASARRRTRTGMKGGSAP